MITLNERLANHITPWHLAMKALEHDLRVAMPAIVQSYDEATQTVAVLPAIREQILNKQRIAIPTNIPLLSRVPIIMMRAGNFVMTMPIQAGDECLLVASDACIDGWWQNGGVQNQVELRRHDISDCCAIFGLWSQQRLVPNYSTTAAQLRSLDGTTVVEVGDNEITVQAQTVNVQATGTATVSGQQVNVTGSESVTISGNNQTTIDGVNFLEHTHTGVTAGGGVTGPVVP
jgi:Phage protein Gp138 N-terminal domain